MKSSRKLLCLLLILGFAALLAGCASTDDTDPKNESNQAWDRPMPWQNGIPGLDSMPGAGANGNSNAYGH
jgi:PBP1b-binding outer membrane lipoprotein LpoB